MDQPAKTGKYVSGDFFYNVKRAAEKRKIPFFITIEDLDEILEEQDFRCAYTGRPIDAKSRKNYTASLDRKDSLGPYSRENVQFTCVEANMAKWKMPEEAFLSLVEEIWTHKGSEDYRLV